MIRLASRFWLLTLVCGLFQPCLGSADGDSDGGVLLDTPEVIKTSFRANRLRVSDLNGDGLNDLALINPEQRRIELFLRIPPGGDGLKGKEVTSSRRGWQPSFSNAPFERIIIPMAVIPGDLLIADMDGDGKQDLAIISGTDSVEILYQGTSVEDWARRDTIADLQISTRGGRLFWFEREGSDPLLGYHGGSDLLFWKLSGESGGWTLQTRETLSGSAISPLIFEDLDGDGKRDLVFRLSNLNGFMMLASGWDLNKPKPEELIYFGETLGGFEIHYRAGKAEGLVTLGSGEGMVQYGRLMPGRGNSKYPTMEAMPIRNALISATILLDLNGDGNDAWITPHPVEAAIQVSRIGEDRNLSTVSSPSFKGITEIVPVFGTESQELAGVLVFSPEEGMVGYSKVIAGGKFAFPTIIPVENTPITMGWDSSSRTVAVAVREGRSNFTLEFFKLDEVEGLVQLGDREVMVLDGIRREPLGLHFRQLDEDAALEMMVFFDRDPVRIYDLTEDGWELVTSGLSLGRGSDRFDLANIGAGDLNGDGIEELFVTAAGFVRQMGFDAVNGLVTKAQYNVEGGTLPLTKPQVADVDGDGVNELVAMTADGLRAVYFSKTSGDEYEFAGTLFRFPPGVERLHWMKRNGDLGAVAIGLEAALFFPEEDGDIHHVEMETIFSNLDPEIIYTSLWSGDLSGDGQDEIVLFAEGTKRLEILRFTANEGWVSSLWFPLFEENINDSGRQRNQRDPREVLVADVTGSGLNDLVVLVHDRILIYPQIKQDR
ncbi:MAG: FG-GAP repeat domain-containing protein [Puniceicoccaceae bacterium]